MSVGDTEITVCNLAVSWLGGNLIKSEADDDELPATLTTEGILCNANYDTCRNQTLEARNWTFATARGTLTPSVVDPAFGYTYAFTITAGWLRLIDVDSDVGFTQREHWVREEDRILCDFTPAYVMYIATITDPVEFSANFVDALASRIAANIALPLTGSKDLEKLMEAKYINALETGGAMDGLQGKNLDMHPRNKLILAR